jgi:hypothetical protein
LELPEVSCSSWAKLTARVLMPPTPILLPKRSKWSEARGWSWAALAAQASSDLVVPELPVVRDELPELPEAHCQSPAHFSVAVAITVAVAVAVAVG